MSGSECQYQQLAQTIRHRLGFDVFIQSVGIAAACYTNGYGWDTKGQWHIGVSAAIFECTPYAYCMKSG